MSSLLVLEADDHGNLRVHSDFPCYIQKSGSCRSPSDNIQLKQLTGLPEVKVNVDHLSQSRLDVGYGESPFLHTDQGFFSTVLQKGWRQACSNVLQGLNQHNVYSGGDSENTGIVARAGHYFKQAALWISDKISHAPPRDTTIIEKHAKVLNWSEAYIRALAWHPRSDRLAVAFIDNAVRVYSAPSGAVTPLLKHKLQKGITDLAWMPYSASMLAVACINGVFIWQVEPSSLSSRPSPSSVQFLCHPGHEPVTSIAWAPDGSGILLSASVRDTSVVAWDVATERHEVLKRKGGKGNCHLVWSPDGTKVLCTSPGPLIRVWETKTWTCEKWTSLPGRCSAACWTSSSSDTLLFSTQDAPIIFSIRFSYSPVGGGPCGSEAAVVLMDLREIDLPAPVSERLVGCPFGIHSMAWDSKEGYMAALLTGEDCQGDVVVFRSRAMPVVELTVCGFILGCGKSFVQSINLDKQTPNGTLLTIGWSSGHVSYVPINAFSTTAVRDGLFVTGQRSSARTSPQLFSI